MSGYIYYYLIIEKKEGELDMEYEIVNLDEKRIVGLTARTNNSAPDMNSVIGGLWDKLYNGGIYGNIKNKVNNKAIGVYSDYENNEHGDYDVTIGVEVSKGEDLPKGAVEKIISSGKYAKFTVKGNMVKAVQEFWENLWKMNIDRSYRYDFEEYESKDMEEATINIYISIN